MFKILIFIVSLILVSIFSTQAQDSQLQKWTLSEIVDGDTVYAIDSLGNRVKFRLIGIDAPESRHPFKPVQPFSKEATAYLQELLASSEHIFIEFDIDKFDRYGRMLAYIYTETKQFVNAKMVEEGFAQIMTYAPNVKYVETFYDLQKSAQLSRKGMWSL